MSQKLGHGSRTNWDELGQTGKLGRIWEKLGKKSHKNLLETTSIREKARSALVIKTDMSTRTTTKVKGLPDSIDPI